MSHDKAMLPYIHTHRSYSPTLYMEESPYWHHHQRRKWDYMDNYYRLHPHHAYWYDYHRRQHPSDYYTRASLPYLPNPHHHPHLDDVVVSPRLEAQYRYQRDRDQRCAYCPPPVKKLYPSMNYDEAPCPHCDHRVKRRQEEVMAFPWTPQTYLPPDDREELLPLEEDPPAPVVPYAQSAPPVEDNKKGVKGGKPPYSAPPFPLLKPRLGLLSVDQRRQAVRRRPGYMSALEEEENNPQDQISPKDSISNVGIQPYRSLLFHPSRMKTKHSSFSERYFQDLSHRADPTPPPLGYIPRRRLEGQYVDIRNGRKYDYKVDYGNSGEVESDRRVVR